MKFAILFSIVALTLTLQSHRLKEEIKTAFQTFDSDHNSIVTK